MGRGAFCAEAVLPLDAQSMFIERDSAAFRSLLSKARLEFELLHSCIFQPLCSRHLNNKSLALKIGQMEFRDLWEGENGSTFVRLVTKPEFGAWVPKGVAGSVKSSQLEFVDIVEYRPSEIVQSPYRIFVRTESPLLGDKLDIRMTLTIEEVDAESCVQRLEGTIHVGIFGVGRVVESIIRDSLVNTYKKLPDIVARWAAFRQQAIAAGDGRALLAGRPPIGSSVGWIRHEVECRDPGEEAAQPAPEGRAAETRAEEALELQEEASSVQASKQEAAASSTAHAAAALEQLAQQQLQQQQQQQVATARPLPSPSPSLPPRKKSSLQQLRLASATTVYYDAEEGAELGEGRASARDDTAAGEGGVGAGGTERQDSGSWSPLLPSTRHHARSASVDSVGLSPGAGPVDHKASGRLWQRFNSYWHEWESYWGAQGVEAEAAAAEREEMAATHGSLLGQVFSSIGREMYYTTSLLLIVAYVGLMRRGVLDVHPDAPPHARRTRGSSFAPAPSRLGERRTVSLDRAEAELAARVFHAGPGEMGDADASATLEAVSLGGDGSPSRSRKGRGSAVAASLASLGLRKPRRGRCFCMRLCCGKAPQK
eukprot:scaffold4.g4576.t1